MLSFLKFYGKWYFFKTGLFVTQDTFGGNVGKHHLLLSLGESLRIIAGILTGHCRLN